MPEEYTQVHIRMNGTGNAWPVFVGDHHPFYSSGNPDDLGNASYSIFGTGDEGYSPGNIRWSLLVDAGHNTPSYLIRNDNRLPDGILLTHPHPDHILGVDWVAESFYYKHNKSRKYPVYATLPCWEAVKKTFPLLHHAIEFKELIPSIPRAIDEVYRTGVTALPVYHGERGFGASMLVFEFQVRNNLTSRAAFSGDMLCALLNNSGCELLGQAGILIADCNNRFSYPLSSHGSLSGKDPSGQADNRNLLDFLDTVAYTELLAPHIQEPYNKLVHNYFKQLVDHQPDLRKLPFSLIDLARLTGIKEIWLVHYSGREDKQYNNEKILNRSELERWANETAAREDVNIKFVVPGTGDFFRLV